MEMKLSMDILEFFVEKTIPNHVDSNHDDFVLDKHFINKLNGGTEEHSKHIDVLISNITKEVNVLEKRFIEIENMDDNTLYNMQYESIINNVEEQYSRINATAKDNQDLIIDVLNHLEIEASTKEFEKTINAYRSEYIKKENNPTLKNEFSGFSTNDTFRQKLLREISDSLQELYDRSKYIESRAEIINEFVESYILLVRKNPYICSINVAYEYDHGLMGEREKVSGTLTFHVQQNVFDDITKAPDIADMLYKAIKENFGTWHPNNELECGFFDNRLGVEIRDDLIKNINNILMFGQTYYYETQDNTIISIECLGKHKINTLVV